MPWNEPAKSAILVRPVTARASRSAAITASVPELQNVTRSTPVSSRIASPGDPPPPELPGQARPLAHA
ncbi:MAG TPA: hypothetical protein VMW75_18015 [Thermoanaerobaculia bacterium]|nr:hypothetical protein [Thermoanaerobaculia bacterium]